MATLACSFYARPDFVAPGIEETEVVNAEDEGPLLERTHVMGWQYLGMLGQGSLVHSTRPFIVMGVGHRKLPGQSHCNPKLDQPSKTSRRRS